MIAAMVISCWLATTPGASRLLTPFSPDPAPATRQRIIEQARFSPAVGVAVIATSLLVTGVLLGGSFWWWRAKNEDGSDAAFRILARRMRLGASEQALVRTLARERSLPPVTLLVSIETLRAVLQPPRDGGEEAARIWLLKRCP